MPLELRPLANEGVEVFGCDIDGELSEHARGELISACNEPGILRSQGKGVTPDKQNAVR